MDILQLLNLLNALLLLLKLKCLIKLRKAVLSSRRWWVKPHLRNNIRDAIGGYNKIFIYYKLQDHEKFYRLIRMSVASFNYLFNIVKRKLTKHGPRKPLSAELKLAVVLRCVNVLYKFKI